MTDVPGVTAAHAAHPSGTTGCTVLRFDGGARASSWACGGAVASREWAVLEPDQLAPDVHALALTGGSAFGLGVADGVMAVLAEARVGLPTPGGIVPIVPVAALWDLDGGASRPGAEQGRVAALACAARPLPMGRVGAGLGARVGRGVGQPSAGGVGTSSGVHGEWVVGVVVAVNAFGLVQAAPPPAPVATAARTGTTLAIIATNAALDRAGCRGLARMASAAFARCFRPAFSPFDGDVVFAVSTGNGPPIGAAELTGLGDAAAELLAAAIHAAVR